MCVESALYREPGKYGGQHNEKEAQTNHQAERPEQRGNLRYGIPRRLPDLLGTRLARVVRVTLEQQRMAQRMPVRFKVGLCLGRYVRPSFAGSADALQGVVGREAVADAAFGLLDQCLDAGNFGC